MVGMINPTFSLTLTGRCYGNRFLARIAKNWHTPSSFCELAFYSEWKYGNMDALTPTMTHLRLIKHLMNFGPVNLAICRRVCAWRATLWPLPRLSSLVKILFCNVFPLLLIILPNLCQFHGS